VSQRNRHGRPIRLATILVIGITLLGAPSVSADHNFVIPADEGCGFDVLVTATHRDSAFGRIN
jgi:hypothetical protein